MSPIRITTWQLRFASIAFLAATMLFATAFWNATHFPDVGRSKPARVERRSATVAPYRFALASELNHAVDFDPFRPERNRPPAKYQLPGAAPVPQAVVAPPPEQIELLGTVVAGGSRSFAMCQTAAGPKIVHIGEKFAGFTLKSVEQGSAVFVQPDGKPLTVTVKQSGN